MTLRETAGAWKIGAAVRAGALRTDERYRTILAQEFNLVVPEDAMKCYTVCRQPDQFDFSDADAIVQFAQAHQQAIRGHVLCWHMGIVKWMKGLSNLELEQFLYRYITTMVDRYRGQVYAWDVLDEAINDHGRLRPSLWSQIESYVPKCFQWAREADPDVELYYLDYRLHTVSRWNAIAKMVEELKANGVPIDGIGFQLHHEIFRSLAVSGLRIPSVVQQLRRLGVSLHFAEVSIPIYPPTQQLPLAARQGLQAQAYRQAIKTALQQQCESFSVWGFSDQHVYYKPPENDRRSAPCIFDADYQPKPAYTALQEELAQAQLSLTGVGTGSN